MKRYLLFAGDNRLGGANDLVGSFDTLAEAIIAPRSGSWAHVFDLERGNKAAEWFENVGWNYPFP